MILALKFAEKGDFINSKEGVQAVIGSAQAALKSESYDQIAYIQPYLSQISDHHDEVSIIQFEIFLLTHDPSIDCFLASQKYEILPILANLALKRSKNDTAKKCLLIFLDKNLEKSSKISVLRELILLTSSFEETDKYMLKVIDLIESDMKTPEIDWLVAISLNSGIKAYSLFQLNIAERWLFFALEISKKINDPLKVRINELHCEVLYKMNRIIC